MGQTNIYLLVFYTLQVFSYPFKSSSVQNCLKCHSLDDTKVNVHLIPHSHDDVGWLRSVDQYYFENVQYIISSVVQALQHNPERRFIQVETAFFWMWWHHQSDKIKKEFVDLVNNGQIEIVNGAWSMNDEGATNYQSIIDQFTWGLRFLNDSLGECGRPKVGWQIDPFGHSREQVSLLSQLGYNGLVLGRVDYRDRIRRSKDQTMGFVWRGSTNLDNTDIFTTILPDHYSAPPGFCFDINCINEPIVDDYDTPEFNLHKRVEEFTKIIRAWSKYYNSNNILITMGDDFQYQAAFRNFMNIDKLIKAFENHTTVNVFYSTPSCYLKAVNESLYKNSFEMELKKDDFFPYASSSHAFWTGYFTSRPNSKRFERTGNNILQAAKQLISLSKINEKNYEYVLNDLRVVMGILQHHDAITGTEREAVDKDYARLLIKSIRKAEEPIGKIISDHLKKDNKSDVDLKLSTCLLTNVSICEASSGNRFLVAIYNPLSRVVSHFVRLPVVNGTYTVTGPEGEEIHDIFGVINNFHYIPNVSPSPKELVFEAKNLPPLGLKLYYIEKLDQNDNTIYNMDNNLRFGSNNTNFELDPVTNRIKSITMNGQTLEITQEFLYYNGSNGNNYTQASGAYVFRPMNGTSVRRFPEPIRISSQRGQLVEEVKQLINSQITQIIRVYKRPGNDYIEFDWLVGNLTVDNRTMTGTEIITRFTVENFNSGGVFYTDSNGREQIKRVLNKREDYIYNATEEPVSSNYYPITSKIVIKDRNRNLEIAVLNDRAQGGSSLNKGTVELMVHRRLLVDDGFGLSEPLNEYEFGQGVYVRGQHFLILGSIDSKQSKSMPAQERDLAQRKLLQPWVLVGKSEFSLSVLQKLFNFQFSILQRSLPENVNILTLEPWKDDSYIFRVEHIFEKNEDDILSQPITIDLTTLFSKYNISEIRETTLGANQWLEDFYEENQFLWNFKLNKAKPLKNLLITLKPMQIRTFIIKIK